MRIYLAQIDTTVGDIAGNTSKVLAGMDEARRHAADLAVFPELAITGYPPRDLLENKAFIADNVAAVGRIAERAGGLAVIVGFAKPNDTGSGNALYNAAAVCHGGRVVETAAKCLLPTYDVFDEDRHFEPAKEAGIVEIGGRRIGLSICEDAWNDPEFWGRRLYERDPMAEQAGRGATFFVNISASPFALGRPAVRERLLAAHAAKHRIPLVYVNLVGGNDQLLFDGRSCVFDAAGRKVAALAAFREDGVLFDLGSLEGPASASPAGSLPSSVLSGAERQQRDAEEAFEALVMGTRDYVSKCGFSRVVMGLSGGIDSSVVAAIAASALGPAAVTGVSMPSRYSSKGSLDDAAALAANLGIERLTIPIEAIVRSYEETLGPALAGREAGVTLENVQARIRGNLLMALSNAFGWLVLTTGNKSEMAVGYTTLYGDMSGGLAVISDVPKTMVYAIARHVNGEREVIPAAVFTKPPSAELRPHQTDQDTLPPYEVLDGILRLYVEEMRSAREIEAAGFDGRVVRDVVRRVDRSEYKRQQAPPGLRITTKAFGLGRRMPIAQRYVEP